MGSGYEVDLTQDHKPKAKLLVRRVRHVARTPSYKVEGERGGKWQERCGRGVGVGVGYVAKTHY